MIMLTYTGMLRYNNFGDRLEYLRLINDLHKSPRFLSNPFYRSSEWLRVRKTIIRRDLGCDLGVFGISISGPIYVHHINPLTEDDLKYGSNKLFDPENLITVSINTHNKIHYGNKKDEYIEREPGDTTIWK